MIYFCNHCLASVQTPVRSSRPNNFDKFYTWIVYFSSVRATRKNRKAQTNLLSRLFKSESVKFLLIPSVQSN